MSDELVAPPELIVIAKRDVALRAHADGVASASGADVSGLSSLLAEEDLRLEPLFGASEETLQRQTAGLAPSVELGEPLDLSLYYRVAAPSDRLEELAAQLAEQEEIEGAYVQPISAPPAIATTTEKQSIVVSADQVEIEHLNEMEPAGEEAPPVSPNFTARQGYLDAAPTGIDARYAWTLPGGRGDGVRIIDCEWGWRFTHEDLVQNQGGVLAGANSTADNHGTAVLGEISGDRNALGITGIADRAWIGAVSFATLATPTAIKAAADRLGPGDIILLEIHRVGPRNRWLPIEWWPADFDAIRYAVGKGIIVVEAGGNGGEDLDDPFYNSPQAGFPAAWRNPLNPANPSSGAVMVGAGNPPAGTHGQTQVGNETLVDRARCNFSNYGSRVDAQGWGWLVTTTGYGDLQGSPPPPDSTKDLWYTDNFSGTSSASPIVVGAITAVQGVLGSRPDSLSPARARELLRATGSPQQDGPDRPRSQRIGNRPNLRQLIPAALQTGQWVGVQFTGTVPPNATRTWFTFRWPAHWHVAWTVVPTTPQVGAPQINWDVSVERAEDAYITYWISITNVTGTEVGIEGRYAVLGW